MHALLLARTSLPLKQMKWLFSNIYLLAVLDFHVILPCPQFLTIFGENTSAYTELLSGGFQVFLGREDFRLFPWC
jgi:predicted phosphohydrolase